jgi:hypothetical protein
VEDRDLHALAQLGLDVEALGRLDVLEIDAAEGRLHPGDRFDERVGVVLGELDVEDVDAGELLEEAPLPSITGLAASGPMLPRPSTAVPLVMTATRLLRAVRLPASCGCSAIAMQASATPGE